MKMNIKVGLLPIACSRFKGMGKETSKLYEKRIQSRLDTIAMKTEQFSTVINPGQIYTRDDAKRAMGIFFNENVDCVFAFFLSWSEDFAWIRFLRDMYPIPVFYAHVIPEINYTNTEGEDAFIEYLSTGGLVGALEGSGSIARLKRPMMYAKSGSIDEIVDELNVFAKASAVRTNLRNCNFGLLNSYNEVMWSTYVDPFAFFAEVGPEIRFIDVTTLEDAAHEVSEKRVEDCIEKLMEKYESRPDVEIEHFKASMRCSLAMEDIARKENISMMVLNDVASPLYSRMGLRPGFYPTPENDGTIAAVPEGDLGVGLAVYILKLLTEAHVNIIEPAYVDNDGSLMVVHAGPNDYTDEQGKTIIARDIRFARSKWKHAGAPFAWYVIPSGIKTVAHISQTRAGKFKLIATLAEAHEIEHMLASYTHGKITFPGKKTSDVMTALLQEGVTQHYAVSPGNSINELRHLAALLGMEFHEI